jgi:hypothetical protein
MLQRFVSSLPHGVVNSSQNGTLMSSPFPYSRHIFVNESPPSPRTLANQRAGTGMLEIVHPITLVIARNNDSRPLVFSLTMYSVLR